MMKNAPAQLACVASYVAFVGIFPSIRTDTPLGGYRLAAVVAVLSLVGAAAYWRSKYGSILTLINLFFVSFFLFCQGQIILFACGVASFNGTDVRDYFSKGALCSASMFSTVCFIALFHGTLIAEGRRLENQPRSRYEPRALGVSMRQVGHTMFALSLVPFLLDQALVYRSARIVGYKALQDPDSGSSGAGIFMKLLGLGTDYYIVAIVLLLIANNDDRRSFRRWFLLFLVYPVWLIALGERTESTAMILIALFLWARYQGRSKAAGTLRVFSAAVALLLVFPSVLIYRNQGIVSPGQVVSDIGSTGTLQTLTDSVGGIGYSIFPTAAVGQLVPSQEPFQYGLTYLAAMTSFVPKLGFAYSHSRLGDWLMHTRGMTYGPGFSIPAEAYMNFGYYAAIPVVILLGVALGMLTLVTRSKQGEGLGLMVGVIFILLNITLPRREFLGVVTDLAWVILPTYLIVRSRYHKAVDKAHTKAHSVRVRTFPH